MGLEATASLDWVPWQAYGCSELEGALVSSYNDAPVGLEATASLDEVPWQAIGL